MQCADLLRDANNGGRTRSLTASARTDPVARLPCDLETGVSGRSDIIIAHAKNRF
jgi:hypothetical protein